MKHTPGPWQFIDILGACIIKAGQREALAYRHSPDEENKANARLMAAAPELLAALQGVLRVADRATDEFDAARAAIQKATGEPV